MVVFAKKVSELDIVIDGVTDHGFTDTLGHFFEVRWLLDESTKLVKLNSGKIFFFSLKLQLLSGKASLLLLVLLLVFSLLSLFDCFLSLLNSLLCSFFSHRFYCLFSCFCLRFSCLLNLSFNILYSLTILPLFSILLFDFCILIRFFILSFFPHLLL